MTVAGRRAINMNNGSGMNASSRGLLIYKRKTRADLRAAVGNDIRRPYDIDEQTYWW